MYAVVSSGGKQYRVEPGTTLLMERVGAGAGDPFTFDRVLLIGDGDAVTVGTPVVDGASVSATVLGEELGPKLVIFKFKQKVKYRRRTGHRQHLVRVRIDAINADGSSTKAAPQRKRATKAEAAETKPEPKAEETKAAETAAPKAAAKPRARRKPAAASKPKADEAEAAKPDEAEASASEEKPKARRTTRSRSTTRKPAAKKPAATDDEQSKEQ